jgi:putative ABC transport system permease protein
MNHSLRSIDTIDLLWAMGLVLVTIGLVQWQKLNLAGKVALAVARTVGQLLVMGVGLQLIVGGKNPLFIGGGILVLTILTSIATTNRISDRLSGLLPIVTGSMLAGLSIALVYTVVIVIKPDRLDRPEYWLGLAGICLGYLLNSTAVAGERLVSNITQNISGIEAHLSLGATPSQAIAPYRRQAISAALLPTIDTLSVAGLVTIPSFLSGEIFSNISPINAAAYQIIILIAILASNTISILLVTAGISRRYFNRFAQIDYAKL